MRNTGLLIGVVTCAISFGSGLQAQQGAPAPGRPAQQDPTGGTNPTGESKDQGSRVQGGSGSFMATGCVREGGATTTGNSSSATSADPYVLADARMGGTGSNGDNRSSAGTSSSSSTTGSASSSAGSTYVLSGQNSQLREHVGHQVEVKGRLATAASAHGEAASPTSNTPSALGAQKIEVESVRMISSTCSR